VIHVVMQNAGSRLVVYDRRLGGRGRERETERETEHVPPSTLAACFCSDHFLAHYLLYNLEITPSVQCMDRVTA
jgi:hypothetical protein